MDSRTKFIKPKYKLIFGSFWVIFLWLGVYMNGGWGEIENNYSYLMMAIGNGGVALGTCLLLISRKIQGIVTEEGMIFRYEAVLVLFIFTSVFAVISILKLIN